MKLPFLLLIIVLLSLSCGDDTVTGTPTCRDNSECPGGYCDVESGNCKTYGCSPAQNECLSETELNRCNDSRTEFEVVTCDYKCYQGECYESNVCLTGETQCVSESTYIECETGLGWIEKSCSDGKKCSEGECKDSNFCSPGEKSCKDRYTIQECNSVGTEYFDTNCTQNQECIAGECQDVSELICSPGDKACNENGQIVTCSEDGLSWGSETDCGTGTACYMGECQDNSICTPEEVHCLEENNLYIISCNSTGTAWNIPEPCPTNHICVEGSCEERVCIPDTYSCNESGNIQLCQEDGMGWIDQGGCPDGENCFNGQCFEAVCEADQIRCVSDNNQYFEICNSAGTSWSNPVSCGSGKTCIEGECFSILCTPENRTCVSDTEFEICNSTGTAYENRTSCPDGQTCIGGSCKTFECEIDDTVCDSGDLKTCIETDDGSTWNDGTSCDEGTICVVDQCKPVICTPNEERCAEGNNLYYQICNTTGTEWLQPVPCGNNSICLSNEQLCQPIVCNPESTRCVSSTDYEICNQLGTAYEQVESCGESEVCMNGVCKQFLCPLGDKRCNEGLLEECIETANGSDWSEGVECEGETVCNNGNCLPTICTPNEKRCSEENQFYFEQCNSTGTEWLSAVPCGGGNVCINGSCNSVICTPSESECIINQNSYHICNETGTSYVGETSCGDDQYCEGGTCHNQTCDPGETLCFDNTQMQQCNSQGSGYTDPYPCGPGLVCQNGSCISVICQSGDAICDGDRVRYCKDDGTGWEDSVDCGANQICEGNQCINFVCEPSEKRCFNELMYQECNSRRTGYDSPVSCQNNQICTGSGVCQDRVCAPGDIECVDSDSTHITYNLCNDTGSGWDTTQYSCGDGMVCDPDLDQCRVTICSANTTRCVDDGGVKYQQCNSLGTSWDNLDSCLSEEICTESGCETVICSAYEEIQCVSNSEYQRCNVNGTGWGENESCGTGYICKNSGGADQCVPIICQPDTPVCIPGENGADSISYRTCNSDGTAYLETVNCPTETSGAPQTCYSGACRTRCDMSALNKSYMGCDYYAIDMMNTDQVFRSRVTDENGDPLPFYYAIIIANPSDYTATVRITDSVGYDDTRTIDPNAIEIFAMDTLNYLGYTGYYYQWEDTHQISDDGTRGTEYPYKITTDLPIIAYQFSPLGGSTNYTNDASILIPTTAYGDSYRTLSWDSGYTVIISKEDGTSVDVGGSNYNLSEGEAILLNTSNGVEISSSTPVGVFGGNNCANVPAGIGYCDHLEQQLFPTNTWGNNYIVVKTEPRQDESEYYKIVAHEDGTEVTLIPAIENVPTLNAGDVFSFNTDQNFKVESNKPIMVGQFLAGSGETGLPNPSARGGDPAYILQVPVEQYRKDYLFLVPDTYGYNYITIVAPVGATVELDGSILTGFTNIGTTGYQMLRYEITETTHPLIATQPISISIVADQPVGISVYGYESDVSYGYPGGLDLKSIK